MNTATPPQGEINEYEGLGSRELTEVDEDMNDMFDLAAPPVEKPVVARLVPSEPSSGLEVILLRTDDERCVVGRSKELLPPFRIDGVDRLSGKHCTLQVDPATMRVMLVDTSTNGTYVNEKRLEKNVALPLNPGDRVSLTKPEESGKKVEFLFQRVRKETTVSEFLKSLTCSICQTVYHRPCSVLPCMHVFCAHCISQWIDGDHDTCAECRQQIQSVRPTHKIQSCVEQLVLSQPELRRSAEEMRELEKLDTIPPGGRVLRTHRHTNSDDDDHNDEDFSEEEDDDEGQSQGRTTRFAPHSVGFLGNTPHRCRQCDTPSQLDQFQCCSAGTTAENPQAVHTPMHLICRACGQPFPERPLCGRPQRCFLCLAPYCNLYFAGPDGGCAAQSQAAGLKPVQDHQRTVTSLPPMTFASNQVEQVILTTYLSEKGISLRQMVEECLEQFQNGNWKPNLQTISGELTPQSAVCFQCVLSIYASLIFHYRRAIPNDDLPESVTKRPLCWYGIQCRTQSHNVRHAQNYNHVCYPEKRKE